MMTYIITQGMRIPFSSLEEIDNYIFHCALFAIARKKPRTRSQFKKDNFKLFEHAQNNLDTILKKAKKYKCYVV
jgi:hypothetical protein